MPHSFIIAGYASCPQLYNVHDAKLIKSSVVLARNLSNDPYQIYIQSKDLNLTPNQGEFVLLHGLTIDGIGIYDWLGMCHDDAEIVFNLISARFSQSNITGNFAIQLKYTPLLTLSYASYQLACQQEDFFAQDNFHETKKCSASLLHTKLKGGLHV